MSETSSCLQKSRDEEKQLRKNFQSNYGVHFVTTLFPELQDRVPDVSVCKLKNEKGTKAACSVCVCLVEYSSFKLSFIVPCSEVFV